MTVRRDPSTQYQVILVVGDGVDINGLNQRLSHILGRPLSMVGVRAKAQDTDLIWECGDALSTIEAIKLELEGIAFRKLGYRNRYTDSNVTWVLDRLPPN
jgi:hypothetical protein